ncbi:MAG: cell division protein ZapA [Gammaproteobacteria bacterium]|nr:cell division protein ZapA [Gammaproteobacteria bacterium]NNF60077.1 cell division protein ZapA [Gammaproteobacteria bacterium]NNM21156.1 cell division protein ZapA [Gammaproteobacteria bacterium]
MSDGISRISVRILEKEYQVACPASERDDLLRSAEMLNRKMREIRDSGKVIGLDRIAVMAALNITNELLQAESSDDKIDTKLRGRVRDLCELIESTSGNGTQQLEL